MSKIQLLIGMVGSSKSEYCKEAAKSGYIICNDDSIVNLVHGDNYTLYDKKLKGLYKTIENSIISSALLLNRNVIIDRTNLDINTRKRYISIAKTYDIPIEAVCFKIEAPEEHAKRRYWSDNRGISYEKWVEIARYHLSTYTPPSLSEGLLAISDYDYSNKLTTLRCAGRV